MANLREEMLDLQRQDLYCGSTCQRQEAFDVWVLYLSYVTEVSAIHNLSKNSFSLRIYSILKGHYN